MGIHPACFVLPGTFSVVSASAVIMASDLNVTGHSSAQNEEVNHDNS